MVEDKKVNQDTKFQTFGEGFPSTEEDKSNVDMLSVEKPVSFEDRLHMTGS